MLLTANIDQLILNERSAIRWYVAWFVGIVLLGVGLVAVILIKEWTGDIGAKVGAGFVLLLAKPPLSELLKRRDRVGTLRMLKLSISQVDPDSPEAKRMKDIVWKTLEKMAGG